MDALTTYKSAAEIIKTAILQGQYEAAKGVNRIQLTVYFAIGKYISLNTRKGKWGTGALDAISQILRKELPGLRGFSASSIKNMRLFYEEWIILDTNSPTMVGEFKEANTQELVTSPTMVGEVNNTINLHQSLRIPEALRKTLPDLEELKKLLK